MRSRFSAKERPCVASVAEVVVVLPWFTGLPTK